MEQIMNVKYVYQDLANIPAEFSLPAGRVNHGELLMRFGVVKI